MHIFIALIWYRNTKRIALRGRKSGHQSEGLTSLWEEEKINFEGW